MLQSISMHVAFTFIPIATVSPSPELLPFGIAVGDVRGPTGDDSASSAVILYVPFTFIGIEYRQIFVRICVCVYIYIIIVSCIQLLLIVESPLRCHYPYSYSPGKGGLTGLIVAHAHAPRCAPGILS